MMPPRTGLRPAARGLPAGTRHQGALDGLRAAAAGSVLLANIGGLTGYTLTGSPLSWAVSRGTVGVPVFFALSGLLLYRPWAAAVLAGQPAPPVPAYLWRRAVRILPAYWVVVLIALPVLSPGPARSAWPWIQYLLLIQNYAAHPWWTGTGPAGLAQTWTLVVDVSFYLALPVIAAGLAWLAWRGGRSRPAAGDVGRRARRLLTGIAVLAASSFGWTVLAYYPRPAFWLAGTLPPMLIWFAAGMAIAVASAWAAAEAGPDGPARRLCRSVASSAGMCGLIAVCAFAIACTPVAGPELTGIPSLWDTEIKTVLFTIVALAVVAAVAFQPEHGAGAPLARLLVSRLLGSRGARFLGKVSYGVFLWQFLVAYALFAALHLKTAFHGGSYTAPEVAGIILAVAAGTTVISIASYYLIERPARRLSLPAAAVRRSTAPRAGTVPAAVGEDEGGRQPADDDQADDLGDHVPEPGHDQAGPPGQEQMLARRPAGRRGQQQAGEDPRPGQLEPAAAGVPVAGRGQEQPGGRDQDARARIAAEPETGEQQAAHDRRDGQRPGGSRADPDAPCPPGPA
jgi:peptidoglycan/LPS O-acetylase OafA/YrhL